MDAIERSYKKFATDRKRLLVPYFIKYLMENTDEKHYASADDIIEYLENSEIYIDKRVIYSIMSGFKEPNEEEPFDFTIKGAANVDDVGDYKYHVSERLFTDNELKFLVNAIASSKFLSKKETDAMIGKIQKLGSKYQATALKRKIMLDRRVKAADQVFQNLDTIYAAIDKDVQISFKYCAWTPKKRLEYLRKGEKYFASPFAVALQDDNYYLILHEVGKDKITHYRIDKMRDVQLQAKGREGKEFFRTFNVLDYLKETFNMFAGKEETQNVSLSVANHLVGVFIDRFGDDLRMYPNFDYPNYTNVGFKVNVSPQFFGWLCGLGSGVKITSPQNVADEYVAHLKKIAKNYGESN